MTKRATAPVPPTHFRHEPEWGGLVAGDPVRVSGFSTNWRFEFVSRVVNELTGESWIETIGERFRGKKTWGRGIRAFEESRVRRAPGKNKRTETEDE